MMRSLNLSLLLAVLLVYFFVTAPVPLDAKSATQSISTEKALRLVNELNSAARSLYTTKIVKPGKKSGIRFDENWQDEELDAGPLPAQFLRLTSRSLEASSVPLGLYLGSDFPINTANRFQGLQQQRFEQLKSSRRHQYFFEQDTHRYYYMAEDVAISSACVSCHNKHKDTPKKDWVLKDVMGATTWSYPDEFVSYQELLLIVNAFNNSVKDAYITLLNRISSFKGVRPVVGRQWPESGYYLPDVESFLQEYNRRAGVVLINELSMITQNNSTKETR